MTFRELSKKEVVQVDEGQCLGKIDDLVIDDKSARVEKLLMLGRPKLFGLLGRGESLVIDWDEIQKIGANARRRKSQVCWAGCWDRADPAGACAANRPVSV